MHHPVVSTSPPVATSFLVAAVAAAFVAATGCQPSVSAPDFEEHPPDEDLPAAEVDLPNPPPESAFEFQKRNDDGTLRVEGLIGHRDEYLDEDIQLRATIGEIVGTDCDPAQPGVETCPRPRLVVRDHPDDNLGLKVVGIDREFVRSADLQQHEEYLFEGTYTEMAHEFVSARDGLIDLKAVDDQEVHDE